jgi:transposase
MMGERRVAQEALFYEFSLDRHVPADHLLRAIDRFVDLSGMREHLRGFYSAIGRPSIDPELMLRMLIVGYCFGIRSERRLCEEVHLNLAYRWFCRLGLDGDVPDHSTFSKNRHGRFRESDLFRQLFEATVRRCIEEGLVGGDGFAVDASLIRAEANRQTYVEGTQGLGAVRAGRAVEEYLAVLDDAVFGGATPVDPKRVSPVDPAARYTQAHGNRADFCYATNYLIDVDNAVIVDVEASTAVRQAEVTAAKRMIERAADCHGLWPRKLIGDTGYGSSTSPPGAMALSSAATSPSITRMTAISARPASVCDRVTAISPRRDRRPTRTASSATERGSRTAATARSSHNAHPSCRLAR